MSVGLGRGPAITDPLEERALVALLAFHRRTGTTGSIAWHLGLRTGERRRLGTALTSLKKRRLVDFEFDRARDAEIAWRLTPEGVTEALRRRARARAASSSPDVAPGRLRDAGTP